MSDRRAGLTQPSGELRLGPNGYIYVTVHSKSQQKDFRRISLHTKMKIKDCVINFHLVPAAMSHQTKDLTFEFFPKKTCAY